MKTITDLLWEAEESLRNISKPNYNVKAWKHNFDLCMHNIFERSTELDGKNIDRFNVLLKAEELL